MSKKDPKEHMIRIRLSGDDYTDLKFVAEALQIPLSTCFRMHGLNGLREKKNDLMTDNSRRQRHQEMLRQQLEE